MEFKYNKKTSIKYNKINRRILNKVTLILKLRLIPT